jgi:hypothetical protein
LQEKHHPELRPCPLQTASEQDQQGSSDFFSDQNTPINDFSVNIIHFEFKPDDRGWHSGI